MSNMDGETWEDGPEPLSVRRQLSDTDEKRQLTEQEQEIQTKFDGWISDVKIPGKAIIGIKFDTADYQQFRRSYKEGSSDRKSKVVSIAFGNVFITINDNITMRFPIRNIRYPVAENLKIKKEGWVFLQKSNIQKLKDRNI
jgi:hypothetical protein